MISLNPFFAFVYSSVIDTNESSQQVFFSVLFPEIENYTVSGYCCRYMTEQGMVIGPMSTSGTPFLVRDTFNKWTNERRYLSTGRIQLKNLISVQDPALF